MIGVGLLLDNGVSREFDFFVFFVVEKMDSDDIDEEKLRIWWYIVYIMLKELFVVFLNYFFFVRGGLEDILEGFNVLLLYVKFIIVVLYCVLNNGLFMLMFFVML